MISWWLCPDVDFAATAQRELPRILADPKAKLISTSPHQFSEPARKKPAAYVYHLEDSRADPT